MFRYIKYGLAALSLFIVVDVGRYLFFPDISRLQKEKPIPTAFMQHRMQQWEDEGQEKKITQKWVGINNISPYLLKAVLISEDDGFYNHEGFEIKDLEEALQRNIKAGKFVAGGSTVTQQLAKNLYLNPSKNPIRKLKEAIVAYRMEKTLSKRRILELYLNCAEWGDGIFGIEAAARHYYGKSAKSLGPKEAAALASILPNPIKYQPGQSGRVAKKTAIIYSIMVRRGIVIKSFEEVIKPPTEEETKAETATQEANDSQSMQHSGATETNSTD